MRAKLNICLQYLAPQHALSHLAGWLSNIRCKWVKNWQINHLIKRYNVDMNAPVLSSIDDYPTFNSFFTRALKPALRPLPKEPSALCSPADGVISQIGKIEHNQLLQAKGHYFSLESLLANTENAKPFYDGNFATIYLSPRDYHRVHMPYTGTLKQTTFIPGKLFSVNQQTATSVPSLFARNERLVCFFDTDFGPMVVILVGAMLVGSIQMVWSDTREKANTVKDTFFNGSITLQRGDELGHFKMGSTVIVVFPTNRVTFPDSLQANSALLMGEYFGKTLPS